MKYYTIRLLPCSLWTTSALNEAALQEVYFRKRFRSDAACKRILPREGWQVERREATSEAGRNDPLTASWQRNSTRAAPHLLSPATVLPVHDTKDLRYLSKSNGSLKNFKTLQTKQVNWDYKSHIVYAISMILNFGEEYSQPKQNFHTSTYLTKNI